MATPSILQTANWRSPFAKTPNSRRSPPRSPWAAATFNVEATLHPDGALALLVDGKQVAEGKAGGLIGQQPKAGLSVGVTAKAAVGDYTAPFNFAGKITNVRVKAAAPK